MGDRGDRLLTYRDKMLTLCDKATSRDVALPTLVSPIVTAPEGGGRECPAVGRIPIPRAPLVQRWSDGRPEKGGDIEAEVREPLTGPVQVSFAILPGSRVTERELALGRLARPVGIGPSHAGQGS